MDIGNAIGKFVYVDPRCLGAPHKRVSWFRIEKESRGGFPDHIDFHWGETHLSQRLDLQGVPFRCSYHHHTRHMLAQCPRRLGGHMQGWHCFGVLPKSQSGRGCLRTCNQHGFTSWHHSSIPRGSHSFHPHGFGSLINGSSPITIPSSPISSTMSDILASISLTKHF